MAGANLKAFVYGLLENNDKEAVVQMLEQIEVPEFKPKSGVKIAVTEAEAQLDTLCGKCAAFYIFLTR